MLKGVHHIAIICSDYPRSKHFYCEVLGLKIIAENYRAERRSYKLDLGLPDGTQIELFSFPDAPERPSYPEAQGLRHLAFAVSSMNEMVAYLSDHDIKSEPIRIDEYTGKRYTFFADPDGLPIELYEVTEHPITPKTS
ncbi:VOC family protein [Corallincola luteus]|uniref:VOC family protein n=2 Tax=Corallincola TaxID=1775176 RepID=A0A368NUQ4_9GAMM|nr:MULTISPECIES: VOC family protein [Corallincola]RCU52941.1 VOC family protein [Corallincola holothuriorum]TCI02541.1 VOC family protein [Corallincola luteus]